MKVGKFFVAIIKDVVAFLCSLGSLASWGAAAMYESKDEKFPVGKALILAGIVGFLVASFRVWKKTDDDLERANDSLKEEGVTKARSQEAKNVLARLSQVNLEGLKRVLRDMPIPEQTLRYLVPGVDINELEKTNFTFWEGDNCLSIKKGYVLVLNDLLFPKEKVHSRSSGLWKTSLYSWVYSQSRGLRRIAKCMKDTHD